MTKYDVEDLIEERKHDLSIPALAVLYFLKKRVAFTAKGLERATGLGVHRAEKIIRDECNLGFSFNPERVRWPYRVEIAEKAVKRGGDELPCGLPSKGVKGCDHYHECYLGEQCIPAQATRARLKHGKPIGRTHYCSPKIVGV